MLDDLCVVVEAAVETHIDGREAMGVFERGKSAVEEEQFHDASEEFHVVVPVRTQHVQRRVLCVCRERGVRPVLQEDLAAEKF